MFPCAGCLASFCSVLQSLVSSVMGEGANAHPGLHLAVSKLGWGAPL